MDKDKGDVLVRFRHLMQFAAKISSNGVDLSKYAKLTDIPSSLPANGGNADSVDNIHIDANTVHASVPDLKNPVYDEEFLKYNSDNSAIERCNTSSFKAGFAYDADTVGGKHAGDFAPIVSPEIQGTLKVSNAYPYNFQIIPWGGGVHLRCTNSANGKYTDIMMDDGHLYMLLSDAQTTLREVSTTPVKSITITNKILTNGATYLFSSNQIESRKFDNRKILGIKCESTNLRLYTPELFRYEEWQIRFYYYNDISKALAYDTNVSYTVYYVD